MLDDPDLKMFPGDPEDAVSFSFLASYIMLILIFVFPVEVLSII